MKRLTSLIVLIIPLAFCCKEMPSSDVNKINERYDHDVFGANDVDQHDDNTDFLSEIDDPSKEDDGVFDEQADTDSSMTCGNGTADNGEACDGDAKDCMEINAKYIGGLAPCKEDCSGYDTSACIDTDTDVQPDDDVPDNPDVQPDDADVQPDNDVVLTDNQDANLADDDTTDSEDVDLTDTDEVSSDTDNVYSTLYYYYDQGTMSVPTASVIVSNSGETTTFDSADLMTRTADASFVYLTTTFHDPADQGVIELYMKLSSIGWSVPKTVNFDGGESYLRWVKPPTGGTVVGEFYGDVTILQYQRTDNVVTLIEMTGDFLTYTPIVLQVGRWNCISQVCTPVYGDAGCGDATCSPNNGESPQSCPADCGAFTSQDGQGKACSDDIDCAFYSWSAGGSGYWECKDDMVQDYCNAIVVSSYCGTSGYEYCYFGTTGIETPATCAIDCDNKPLGDGNTGMQCDSARDCIFLDWPQN